MLIDVPCAVQSSIAGSPGSVAGIFTIRFGRSTSFAIQRAWANVFSVSYAIPGSTSIETKPSAPSVASNAGLSTSHASRMSSSARVKKISDASSVLPSSSVICSSYASPSESAFWKIDGFDVTPVTASSFIIFFNSPELIRCRESVSNQIDCPRAANLCRRLSFAMFHLPLHCGHLLQALDVPVAAVEGRT